MSAPKSVSLYYRAGTSDKVYNVQLWPEGGGWQVFFQYGRRGASRLTSGSKLPSPASYWMAKTAYDELVESKTKKGYSAGALSGSSALTPPTVASAAAKLSAPPVWEGFDALYAQTATTLGQPSSLSTSPDPSLLLLTWLSVELEEGLRDAVRVVKQLSAAKIRGSGWDALSTHLDEDALKWLQALSAEAKEQTVLQAQSYIKAMSP